MTPLVLAQFLGVGFLGVVLTLLAIGIWTKYAAPRVRNEVQEWFDKPEQQKALKAMMKEVIVDEIKRTDGAIFETLDKHVTEQGKAFQSKLDQLVFMQQDQSERLARIEGLLKGLRPDGLSLPPKA